MQYVETSKDVTSAGAWAEIIEDMLFLMPEEIRLQALDIARAKETAEAAERAENGGIVWKTAADLMAMDLRHHNATMRLKGLLIQVFARDITIDHSPQDAAKILFAQHRYGNGSGRLGDYIDDLPRKGLR
jgi:hypothetical protein